MNRKAIILTSVFALSAASAFAANSLSVTSGAALNGTTKGLNILVDPAATNSVYVQSNEPNAETHLKVRMWISAANLDARNSGGGRSFRFMNWRDNDQPGFPHKVFFLSRQSTTGNWRLDVWSRNSDNNTYQYAGGMFMFSYKNNTSTGKVQIECEWTKATSGANGTLTCKKVGTGTQFTTSSLSDSARQTDDVQVGFFDFDNFPNGATTDGNSSLHIDEYESYR